MPLSVTAAVLRPSIPALSLSSSHSSFLHLPIPSLPTISFSADAHALAFPCTTIRAMKSLQGRVVRDVNDKTVSVEVTRLVPHPKYKRRVRKKKKYQAHDPDNVFKVGDLVQLEKCRPISKTKTFLAVPVPVKAKAAKPKEEDSAAEGGGLDIPLESAALQ
ncbi:hypothetical protein MLD38_029451 [Melastoma candidum]|uniref:Uncharacterized protein n=1 Tax=Melastoma candidum TaxID=119954 RepID=A0ACB9N5H6_9MYRT|nr:hypothetical protein MLD38_029451 [Melastoma candidum]